MRIAIFGTGGVGGYFGGRLAAAGTEVAFIARGGHLAALRERGLRIESAGGNVHVPKVTATDDPSTIGPVDVVFLAVKLYDTEAAVCALPPLVGPRTLVVSFQNGVDSVETLARSIGRDKVAGGTAYVAAVISTPGVIRHTAMGRLIFGPVEGTAPWATRALQDLRQACEAAGFDATLSRDITADIWAKFVRLSVFSGITAATRCSIGPLRDDPAVAELIRQALAESMAVAHGRGIPLPERLVDDIQVATAALPANARSSMLEDLERGRPLELPWLSGAVVRIGRELGVPTPVHGFITAVLGPHVGGGRKPVVVSR